MTDHPKPDVFPELAPLCSTVRIRTAIQQPWIDAHDGNVYASDGHVLIRCPGLSEPPKEAIPIPLRVLALLKAMPAKARSAARLRFTTAHATLAVDGETTVIAAPKDIRPPRAWKVLSDAEVAQDRGVTFGIDAELLLKLARAINTDHGVPAALRGRVRITLASDPDGKVNANGSILVRSAVAHGTDLPSAKRVGLIMPVYIGREED